MPWVSLIAGFGGSLHCVGMCGGLVSATCSNKEEITKYQIGRLTGYLTLGFFASLLGKIFTIQSSNPKLTLIPGLVLGALFLYWGIQNFRGLRAEIPTPKILSKIYSHLWKNLIIKKSIFSKSYSTGLLSIFLPCGLLYGIVLGVAAFDHSFKAVFSMFFFWLGTLPSMVLAPSIVQKLLKPLKAKLPRTYAISLILIGLMTITFRVMKFNEVKAQTNNNSTRISGHHCH